MAGPSLNLPYKFNAENLAQAAGKNNPQKMNGGMIEFHDNNAIKGLLNLSLFILSAVIPQRMVETVPIPYLNGSVNTPSKVQPLQDMTVIFLDYVDTPARAILEQWFKLVYDEETGLMTPPTQLKTDATFLLFGSDGNGLRGYDLHGIFPKQTPERTFDFSQGEHQKMTITFSVDRVIPLIGTWPSQS